MTLSVEFLDAKKASARRLGLLTAVVLLMACVVPKPRSTLYPTYTPYPTCTPYPSYTPAPGPTPTLSPGATRVWEPGGSVMVYVPAGVFWMGSGDDDPDAWVDESPRHEVYLDAFWIDRTEVTNAQYAAFLEDQGNRVEGSQVWLHVQYPDYLIENAEGVFQPKEGYEDYPVTRVTWFGARAYCEWAGKRLPTETEWEKAARGTDGRIYPWGNEFDGTRLNFCDASCPLDSKNEAWDDGFAEIAPVGSYPDGASPYGALDMAGNVWEWVEDWYREIRHGARVVRGGSWYSDAGSARAAKRYYGYHGSGYPDVGLRCISHIPDPDP